MYTNVQRAPFSYQGYLEPTPNHGTNNVPKITSIDIVTQSNPFQGFNKTLNSFKPRRGRSLASLCALLTGLQSTSVLFVCRGCAVCGEELPVGEAPRGGGAKPVHHHSHEVLQEQRICD